MLQNKCARSRQLSSPSCPLNSDFHSISVNLPTPDKKIYFVFPHLLHKVLLRALHEEDIVHGRVHGFIEGNSTIILRKIPAEKSFEHPVIYFFGNDTITEGYKQFRYFCKDTEYFP